MRTLAITPSNRCCRVEPVARLDPAALRRDILNRRRVQSGFSILTAPAPAHDDTLFMVAGNGRAVLVAAALFDSLVHLAPPPDRAMTDSLEILVDPRCDRLGYVQFILQPGAAAKPAADEVNPHRDRAVPASLTRLVFQPYPEAASSAFKPLAIRRWEAREEWVSDYSISAMRIRWVFAWFDARSLFAHGDRVGFNVVRYRPAIFECSSWNYCSGNGSPDATGFGTLYRDRLPRVISVTRASLGRDGLELAGTAGTGRPLPLTLAAPDGAEEAFTVKPDRAGRWSASLPVTMPMPGRYRLRRQGGKGPAEPDFIALDLPDRALSDDFKVSLLFDTPMCVVANYYTPARLKDQMRLIRGLGIDRIHWLEYGRWPSFWTSPTLPWAKHAKRTLRDCPDLLGEAVRAAHAAGLEMIGNFKPFDLGFNCFFVEPGKPGWGAVPEIENRFSCAIPEIEAHPEWAQQDNPGWRRPTAAGIGRIRFHSLDPIPETGFRLFTSRDNRTFRPYRGPVRFRRGKADRPHQAWTPAGVKPDRGRETGYFVEWSGLAIRDPYLAIRLDDGVRLRQRGFRIVEVWGDDGREAAHTVATNGTLEKGFFFWKGWQGWNNIDENLLQERTWEGANLGLVFREAESMPTLLEPSFEGARRIWLDRLVRIMDAGADGVSIRTYCHHNGPMHYLKFAYARPVVEAFKEAYGREPEPVDGDAIRIRRIRADFYSRFIQDASLLVRGRGGRFMVELESGVEVPDTLSSRMQLPLEWERWIREGWLDEIRLKYFTAENPFIHNRVMPLARAHGLPVELISRCLHQGVDGRTREIGSLLGRRAVQAGFSGYCLYEQQNLMDINAGGMTVLKGPVAAYIRALRGVDG